MAEFARYYVEFLWNFVQNVWGFLKGLALTFYKFFITDIGDYFKQLSGAVGNFDVLGWILLILTFAINACLIFFLIYRLCQLIRRYILYRSKEVEKDKLMEEIAKLKAQSEELVKEKKKIFDLKVNRQVFDAQAETGQEPAQLPVGSPAGEVPAKTAVSRFVKLINLDEKYARNPNFIYMEESDMIPLDGIVRRFVNFAASQLKLYYTERTIRQYFAGMAASKILILEGISGTGKTSLPYAMGKFFNNNTALVSVQPSWRDRSELLGYFNEFTKKFNETDFLSALYESTLREDPNFIVLDEMNLARIEYYFAEFLSIMEMPDIAEWKIDLVPESLPTDPRNVVYGKLLVPQNVWFVGTANNDDSTFSITDKVYDRAVALELNEKAGYFDAEMTPSFNCSHRYLESLFEKAQEEFVISDKNLENLKQLDDFIQSKFKIGFGNRVMKQIKHFVPVYIACGGTETEALDFMVASKILRKFTALNLPFLTKELGELIAFLDRKFGKNAFAYSIEYINQLRKIA